ncbi:E3 ubiquitin-protein ligase PUB24-like [Apium graveolens]|uniref:E3 ubiquitin-protein ligase PUB24-like n=1 Tax=Apium graveolens TaxID=4045 RepID=UPI003D7981AF
MEEVEVPEFFICPISLQIMKDPVIAITGITYDRSSIEKWLNQKMEAICPVSKQPLPRDSILTPNHILSKLIQTWHTTSKPIDHHSVPDGNDFVISKPYVITLLDNLSNPNLQLQTLTNLEVIAAIAKENYIYGQLLVEAGVPKAMVRFVVTCHKNSKSKGLELALNILLLIYKISPSKTRQFILSAKTDEIIDSLIWALGCRSCDLTTTKAMKNHAMILLMIFVENTSSNLQERFKPDFFKTIVNAISKGNFMTQHGTRAALHIMLSACSVGKNRIKMVEVGAVFAIIELELAGLVREKRTSELSMQILFNMCRSADGRAELLSHAAGIAVVTKRIMKVSPTSDEAAVSIISLISKFSGTDWVVNEMLRVGTVSRLCMVLQSNCGSGLKEKAMEILRRHTHVWQDSPCVDHLLLTMYTK